MIKAIDVADYLLNKMCPMSPFRLHKFLYYAQAWHLVWQDKELFPEEIKAWVSGPVIVELYELHKGIFPLHIKEGFFGGDTSKISEGVKNIIEEVINFYGERDNQWLSDLIRMEEPYICARSKLKPSERSERGDQTITKESMLEYYSSISSEEAIP